MEVMEEQNDPEADGRNSIKVSWTDESVKMSLKYDWTSVVSSSSSLLLMFEGGSVSKPRKEIFGGIQVSKDDRTTNSRIVYLSLRRNSVWSTVIAGSFLGSRCNTSCTAAVDKGSDGNPDRVTPIEKICRAKILKQMPNI